ncbi:S8 family serine peptidase [Candidatus Jorgensenbacteria bacterium]|nr:S8 family serine peptidase [Candidatus Jorgensenbacteria bacterium]
MKIHKKLTERYKWYEAWHRHPRHQHHHWFVLILISIAFVTAAVFTTPPPPPEKLQANLNIPHNLSMGKNLGSAPDHILVKFRDDVPANERAQALKRHNLQDKTEIKGIDVRIVSIPDGSDPLEEIQKLQNQEGQRIEFAEVDMLLAPSATPNDPEYINEWHLAKINAPSAWDTTRGENITIAIADTGVDSTHPDLAPHLVPGWNLAENNSDTNDVYGHGTAVAGTAAAVGDNSLQVTGLAYNAYIMPLRISDINGNAYYSIIANAITYAADHGAKIVNVSYQAGGSATVERAARYLKKKGGLAVVAEGNTGGLSADSNSQSLINVAATDSYDSRAGWSTYGNDVDVAAPGQVILSTARGGATNYWSGTSFSAPLVSGLLALIWSANPNLTPDNVQDILFSSSLDLGEPGWDQYYGWGRIDAAAAVANTLTSKTSPNTVPKGRR